MNRARLKELLGRFSQLRIVVAGDLFLDRWYEIDTQLNEPSLETGLTAYQIVKKRSAAGAAGTVLNNLSEMGIGHLEVISLVGEDGDGWEMLQRLNERGVDTSKVLQSDRVVTPAYIKPLFPRRAIASTSKTSPQPRKICRRKSSAASRRRLPMRTRWCSSSRCARWIRA